MSDKRLLLVEVVWSRMESAHATISLRFPPKEAY